ncbi:hypothetical protein [Vibrio phage vB_VpaS_ALK]|nr:hypothetical protein [Vibrio phage vB_VpaS_ALK]
MFERLLAWYKHNFTRVPVVGAAYSSTEYGSVIRVVSYSTDTVYFNFVSIHGKAQLGVCTYDMPLWMWRQQYGEIDNVIR